jgi:hypothetical protein
LVVPSAFTILAACGSDPATVTPDAGTDAAADVASQVDAADASAPGCATAGCDANATCLESGSGPICTCKPGFVGDGKTCTDVAGSLSGLRWELPCTAGNANPALCAAAGTVSKQATLAGQSGTTYQVKLRFRGIIEPNAYSGGTGSGYFYTGGTASDPYANVYLLAVSQPAQNYYVNAGVVRPSNDLYCDAIDYEATIDVAGGAKVTLSANTKDALQIKNRDKAGNPYVIADVPPAPQAYNGQFVQMDVVSVTPK